MPFLSDDVQLGDPQAVRDVADRAIGAIEAIAVHPDNSNIAYVGSVNGGIWRTGNLLEGVDNVGSDADDGTNEPDWTPLTDRIGFNSISDITFTNVHPINGQPRQPDQEFLYAATGRVSSFGFTTGARVLRSVDAGQNWTVLDPLRNEFDGYRATIRSVVTAERDPFTNDPTRTVMIAAMSHVEGTNAGVYRSLNGGEDWTKISGTNGLPLGSTSHLIAHPNVPGRFYVMVTGIATDASAKGIYVSNNNGNDWAPLATHADPHQITGLGASRRLEMAFGIGPNPPIYVAVSREDARLANIFRSTDNGATWSPIEGLASAFPSSRMDKHFAMHADLTQADRLYVSGQGIHTPLDNFVGITYRVDLATTPPTWTQFVLGDDPSTPGILEGPVAGTAPHADSREMVVVGNHLLQSDDGGLYMLEDFSRWRSLNGNLRITEVLSVRYDPFNDVFVAGTQDNGSLERVGLVNLFDDNGDGIVDDEAEYLYWRQLPEQGDGNTQAFAIVDLSTDRRDNDRDGLIDAADPTETGTHIIHYSMGNNFHSFVRRRFKTDGSYQAVSEDGSPRANDIPVALRNLHSTDAALDFDLVPYEVNVIDPTRLLIGYNRAYESRDFGQNLTQLSPIPNLTLDQSNERAIKAVAYGGRKNGVDNAGVAYVAFGGRVSVRLKDTLDGSGFTTYPVTDAITGVSAILIRDIVLDPDDYETAYVVDLERVFRTTDGGKTWRDISGNLPTFGDSVSRRVEFVRVPPPPGSMEPPTDVLLVAGNGAVYRSVQPGPSGTWTEFGQFLANVPITDLHYQPPVTTRQNGIDVTHGDFLYVGTAGRGVYKSEDGIRALLAQKNNLTIDVSAVTPTPSDNTNRVVLTRNQLNPLLLDVYVNNPTYFFALDSQEPDLQVEIGSLDRIEVLGGSTNDVITISSCYGLINPPEGVHVFGNGPTNSAAAPSDSVVSSTFCDTVNDSPPPGGGDKLNISGLTGVVAPFPQPDDDEPDGRVTILDADGTATIHFTGIEHANITFPHHNDNQQSRLAMIGHGLLDASGKAEAILDSSSGLQGIFDNTEAGTRFDISLNQFLGMQEVNSSPTALPTGATGALTDLRSQAGELLRSLFETDTNSLQLDQLGSTITTTDQLLARLDELGDVQPTADGTGFDVQITRTLNGEVPFEFQDTVLGVPVQLTGLAELSADFQLHLIFGVDDAGFYIDPSPDSELVISNIRGKVQGSGRFGFVEVALDNGQLVFAHDTRIEIDLTDPDGGANSPFLRLDELSDISSPLVTTQLVHGTIEDATPDVRLEGQFSVAIGTLTVLSEMGLRLDWNNITELDTLSLTAFSSDETPSRGQQLLELMTGNADQIVTGIRTLAGHFHELGGIDVMSTPVPLINKTIGEILDGQARDLSLPASTIDFVSEVIAGDDEATFLVTLTEASAMAKGIAIGQTIAYTSDGQEVSGVVRHVSPGTFTVGFAGELNQAPDLGTSFSLRRDGSLTNQLQGFLNGLSLEVPTLQELIHGLATRTGLDVLSDIQVVGQGQDLALEFPLNLSLDPLTFDHSFDFGTAIAAGLEFSANGQFAVTVSPSFQITVGVRLAQGVPLTQRFFIKADDLPEVSVSVTATLDDLNPTDDQPLLSGRLGFLNVKLEEQTSHVLEPAVSITGTIELNLVGSSPETSRIPFDSLSLQSIDPSLSLAFDIPGLVLSANVGNTTLGTVSISLDGETEGQVTQLGDFSNVVSALRNNLEAQSNFADFAAFQNITPEMVFAALQQLVVQLQQLGRGDLLDQPLPLINRSVSELIDLGDAWSQAIGSPSSANQVTTVQALEDFFNSRLGTAENPQVVTVRVSKVGVEFDLDVKRNFHRDVPLAFALGNGGISLQGNGSISLDACAAMGLTVGISAEAGVPLAERIYVDTSGDDEVTLHVRANSGYQPASANACGVTTGGTALDVSAAVGPLALAIDDGRVLLDLTVSGDLQSSAANQRLTLPTLGAADFVLAFDGAVQAIIPLDGNGGGVANSPSSLDPNDARVELGGTFTSITNLQFDVQSDPTNAANDLPHNQDPSQPLSESQLSSVGQDRVRVVTHNLDGLIKNNFLNFGTLITGLEQFLEWADKFLGTDALDAKIPFIGKSLHDGLNFLESDRPGVQTVRSLIDALIIDGAAGLQANASNVAVNEAIGFLREALRKVPGVRPIVDADEDGQLEGDMTLLNGKSVLARGDDLIVIDRDEVTQRVNGVKFMLQYAPEFNVSLPFDLGVDFLRFQADASGEVRFDGDLALQLAFGLDRETGFYFETSLDGPEFSLGGRILPQAHLNARLGFLDVTAVLEPSTSYLTTRFSLDLDGGDDGRLTLDELLSTTNFSTLIPEKDRHLEIEAHVNALLTTGILTNATPDAACGPGQASGPLTQSGVFPSLSATLAFDWAGPLTNSESPMDPNPSDGRPFDLLHLDEPVTPELALRNVQLDVGSFLDDLVKPMLQKIQDANLLPPKLIDFINKELPVINKTPRELLTERMTDQQQKVFEFVFNLAGLIQQTDAQSGNLAIQFGDIVIAADADRPGQAMAAPVLSDDQVTTTAGTPGQEKMTDEDDPISIPGSGLPIVGPFLERLGDLGIFFPMLRLSNLSQLLVGNDIDLVLIDVPTLELTKEFDQSIPLLGASFGPVTVGATLDVSGGFELRVEIDGGIDTSGLRQGRFLDGFYLGDFEPGSNRQIDTTDSERREIELIGFVQAALTGSASVGEFELAEVSGYFRLEASLYADLNDDNAINGVVPTCDDRPPAERTDGKLHFGEAKTIVRSHGDQFLSILDIGGRVDAELGLHVTVLNGILFDRTYSFAFPIANFELTFDVNCPPELEGDEAFDDNVGPAGFQLDPLGNGVLRIDDLAPNVDADLDDVTVDTINQNGDLLDGNIIASFDVDELLFEQFGEDVIFELAIPELDLIDSNIVAGQALTWEQDNLPMTGIITNVTSNRFQVGSVRSVATALPAIPAIPAGAEPIRAISNVNVFSGNELTVVQAGGYLQYFGPELCGPAAAPESGDINRIDIVLERGDNTVTLSPSLTTPANVQFGAGNDRLFGGSGPLVAFGGAGRDVLLAGERTTRPGSVISSGNPSQLDGGSDSDILRGSLSADVLTGGEGDDLIFDGPARSQITFRASSQDHLVGGGGKDHIESRGGDDLLVGDYDEQIDRRPSDPGRQTESADTIKQSGIGRASVFGDNRAAADATVGVSPAANRDTADTIVTSDARTQVFAESGDSINSIQGTNDSVTVKISAEKQGVTVTPARIILQDQKPVLLGTRSHVTVTDSDGHVTIQGSKLNDFVTVAHAVEGLSIQFLGGGTVVVPGATTVQFFGNAGDDILTWQISSEATGLTRLDFDGEGGNAGDTLRLIGDDRTRIRASADVRTSIAGTLSNGETDVRFVNASTIDVSRLAALSWSTGGGADQYRLQAAQGPNQQPAMQMFGQADRIVHSSLLIHDVQDVLLDTSAGDAPSPAGDDAISVALDGLTARGLSTLTFSTGAGNDTLDVVAGSYTLPVAGGGLFFDGGTGIDRIVASADVNFTLSDLALTSSRGGAIRFANLVGEEARLTGGVGVNTFAIRDWSGNVSIDGDLGNDLLDLVLRGTTVTALESLTLASHVTVNSANRASVLRGPIELGSANRSFTVNDGSANADLIVESLLSGRVGIAKSGAGTMSLLTANSYTGTTDVTAGLLRVDGNQPQSRVTVRGTGILGGAGRVGSVTVSGGQLQPGSDVGRLTTAALNFIAPTPASTWQLNGTTAATSHDQIEVVGTVSLNGTLHVNPGFTPVVGDTFTIIANDGTDAIGGTFAGLPEGGTFTTNATTYRITYRGGTGNDVVLTAIANTAPRFPNRTITSPVAEGGLVTITGDISEPDPGDLFFLDVNWGDGSALETYTFQGSSPQASVTHRYADDSGSSATSYTVRLLWRDQHGAFNLGDLPVTILNRPPVIEPLADVTLEPGERFLLSGQFSDPGADRWTATVDYGDGAGRKILPLQDQQFTLINHYAQPGFYTVTVDVKDDDGGVSQESLLVRVWPSDVAQPGDANRDRQFSSADLTAIFLAGKYETNEAADWEEGDWNGDGLFNTRDLVLAMITGNYEQGRYAQRHANDRALSLFDVEPQVGSSIRSNTVDPLFAEAVADEDDFGWLI